MTVPFDMPSDQWTSPVSKLQAARFAQRLYGHQVAAKVRALCAGHRRNGRRQRCGFDEFQLSRYECGVRRPGAEHLKALCRLYGKGPDELGLILWRGRPARPQPAHTLPAPVQLETELPAALTETALPVVRLAWQSWCTNPDAAIAQQLQRLVDQLDQAATDLAAGRPGVRTQALLAGAHEALGQIAFDQLAYRRSASHFREMYELGVELGAPAIAGTALAHQADLNRRRGRYRAARRLTEVAHPLTRAADAHVQGVSWLLAARLHAETGDHAAFARAIDRAEACAEQPPNDPAPWCGSFTRVEVLQERAQGLTLLGDPTAALEIYTRSAACLRPHSLRDQGNLLILQAQAYAAARELDTGVQLAIQGLELARSYGSTRHISRVQRMHNRLTAAGARGTRLEQLREALAGG